MFWADKIADEVVQRYQDVIDSGKSIIVRDEKTASGHAHVGSLRSAAMHAVVADVLNDRGIKAEFLFEINDFDPMDGIPGYLDEEVYRKYMGHPLYKIPSPDEGYENFAELYGQEYVQALGMAGFSPSISRATELYASGKMNDAIRAVLDKKEIVHKIYKEVSGSERDSNWYPLNVICEKCGNLSSTKIIDWDGKKVTYICTSETIAWAEGCGYEGIISPFDGNASLPWKPEWAAKFLAYGVHFEGAGKDHYSKGGARQVAEAISREVLDREPPYGVFNEFFLVGGKKMSSSKGNAATARGMVELLPAHILRFLLLKTPINRQIDFDPNGDAVPVLFDTYDRFAEKYWGGVEDDDSRVFYFAHLPEERRSMAQHFLPRFSQIAFLVQMPHINLYEEVAKMKGEGLTDEDKREVDMRAQYSKQWLAQYAEDRFIFALQDALPKLADTLSGEQKSALHLFADKLEGVDMKDGQIIHELTHRVKEESGLSPKEFFTAVYTVFLGKNSGPKVGWFLSTLERDFVIQRLRSV